VPDDDAAGAGADRLPALAAGGVHLRGFEPADLGLVAEAAADPRIVLISRVPSPFTEGAGRQFIERQRHRLRDGFGYSFVIVADGPGGGPVGSIGLWLRDIDQGRASVGYWVVERARGQGAATAALGAVADWALTDLAVPRLELYAEPSNAASIRVAEANGFVREGLLASWQVVGGERRDMVMLARVGARDR